MKHQRCDLLIDFQNPGVFQEKKKRKKKVTCESIGRRRPGLVINVRGELPIQEETKRWLIFSAVYEWHIWMPIENRSKMAEITSEPCNSPSVGALIGCVIIWVLFTV